MAYVTAAELRAWRGVQPADFRLEDEADPDAALDDLLNGWSDHVKDLIDDYSNVDFLADADGNLDDVSGTVRTVALRALSNYVTLAQNAREGSHVRIDEWRVGVEAHNAILTEELTDELDLAISRRMRRERMNNLPFRGFVSPHSSEST